MGPAARALRPADIARARRRPRRREAGARCTSPSRDLRAQVCAGFLADACARGTREARELCALLACFWMGMRELEFDGHKAYDNLRVLRFWLARKGFDYETKVFEVETILVI